jgi:hypothetical protein
MPELRTQENVHGAFTVFRVLPGVPTATLAGQLPRRERWVFLLLDGKRTVADLARLTQRSELDVAATLAKFLQWGSIEPVSREQFRTTISGRDTGSV